MEAIMGKLRSEFEALIAHAGSPAEAAQALLSVTNNLLADDDLDYNEGVLRDDCRRVEAQVRLLAAEYKK